MKRIILLMEYEGTAYAGFQLQPDRPSIQGVVEKALESLYREPIRVIPSGRTDAGVHARKQVIHFDAPRELQNFNPKAALNSLLPQDIRILAYAYAGEDFHARYSAVERHYRYIIHLGASALERDRTWQLFREPDLQLLQECAAFLMGEHDFTSFCNITAEVNHKRCTIYHSEWRKKNNLLIYDISANRFLYNMVRSLVGTLVEAGLGRISSKNFLQILQAKDRLAGAVSAPPQGLYLMHVRYDTAPLWEKESL